MAIKRRKFQLGVRLKPTTQPTVDNGDISVSSVDNKIKTTTYTYAEFDVLTPYSVGDKVKYSPENKNYVCTQAGTGNLPTNTDFWEVYEQSIVTEDQDQTLTNKTIDADNNTISNIETDNLKAGVLVTDISTATSDTELPSALAVKTALDSQNEASEIDYDNSTSGLAATKVQGAIDEVDQNLDDHIADTIDAHDASAISYDNGSSGLTADNTQDAIDEIESRLGTSEGDLGTAEGKIDDLVTLSGVAANSEDLGTFTGNIISDNTTVKGALQELETQSTTNASTLGSHIANTTSAHGVMGAVVGTLNFQTIKFKQYEGASFRKMQKEAAEDNTQSGTDVVLTEPTDPIVRLLGDVTPLESIAGISQASYAAYQVVTLVNVTANDIEIKNNTGTTAEERILTGTGENITLTKDAALFLKYDANSSRWRVIGGTGGSSSQQTIKLNSNENIVTNDALYISSAGEVGKLDADNDNKVEFIGFAKAAGSIGEAIQVVISGKLGGFSGLTPGEFVYADPSTPGGVVQSEPTQANVYIIKLGKAISATEILVNPDLAVSAEFNSGLDADDTINNGATNENVSGLLFDGTIHRAAKITYSIYRYNDTEELSQVGDFKVLYKPIEGTWSLGADNYHGDNAGVTFTITSSGQVQYTSTSLVGANYGSKLQIKISELFDI